MRTKVKKSVHNNQHKINQKALKLDKINEQLGAHIHFAIFPATKAMRKRQIKCKATEIYEKLSTLMPFTFFLTQN
jgi:hypothetical protein